MLVLLHASGLLWWSYSATFMCYEYSVHPVFNFIIACLYQRKGWNSGYIHELLCLCQRRGGTLATHQVKYLCTMDEQYSYLPYQLESIHTLLEPLADNPKPWQRLAMAWASNCNWGWLNQSLIFCYSGMINVVCICYKHLHTDACNSNSIITMCSNIKVILAMHGCHGNITFY